MLRRTFAILIAAMIGGFVAHCPAGATNTGPDPAVVEMSLRDIKPSRPGHADFKIVCVIRNIGTAPFVSTKRGQGVAMYEMIHGESESHRLRYRRFADLDVGEFLTISKWIKDWPVKRDFPSNFECRLEYDFEKRQDQDARNDDCDLTNNRQIVRGINILQLLNQPMRPVLPILPGQMQ